MRIVGGIHRNRKLIAPKGQKTRPTSERLRESLFNICQGWIEGARVLDLFSGSGAVGLEALSRGAAEAVFVDSDRQAIRSLKQNAADLLLEPQIELFCSDAIRAIERLHTNQQQFDMIFADPPYNKGFGEKVLEALANYDILAVDGTLFVEESVKLSTPDHFKLHKTRKVGGSLLHEYRRNK